MVRACVLAAVTSLVFVSDAINFLRLWLAGNGSVAAVTQGSSVVFQVQNPFPEQQLHVCRVQAGDPTCHNDTTVVPASGTATSSSLYTVISSQTSAYFLPYGVGVHVHGGVVVHLTGVCTC